MEQLKKFLKGLWTFLNSKVFQYGLVILLVLFLLKTCGSEKNLKRENKIQEQNIAAANDTIKKEKTKNGKYEYTIAGYVASKKELEDVNSNLSKEVNQEKGKVLSLNKLVFQLKQDTTELRKHLRNIVVEQPIKLNDSAYIIPWSMNYTWDSLNYDNFIGQTKVGITIKPGFILKNKSNSDILNNGILLKHYNTELISRESQMDLIFGQKVEDKQLRIFARTNYPGFNPKSLEGVLIDPNTNPYIKSIMKKHKILFPNTWTLGVGTSSGYNLFNAKPYLGVGVNLTYNIYQF